jgi:hypothetical protein
MHHGRLAFHVQDGADGPHYSKPIKTPDPVRMALTTTIIFIYLIVSDLVIPGANFPIVRTLTKL